MAGTKNSGRKKMFENPKEVHFTIEQTEYDELVKVMNADGYKEFNAYMREVVRRLLE